MATTSVGEIELDLVLNEKDIDKNINKVAKSASSKISNCFGNMSKTMKNSFSSGSSRVEDLKNKISQTEKEISKLIDEITKLSNISAPTQQMQKYKSLISSTQKEIEELSAKMEKIADTKVQTDEYKELCDFYEKLNKRLNTLLEKQEKFKNTNVSQNGKQWKNLQYDIDEVKKSIMYAKGEIKDMNLSGTAFKSGKQTEEYKKVAKEIEKANEKLKTYRKNYNQAFAEAESKRNNELTKKSLQLDKLCDKLDVYKMKLQETSNKEKNTGGSSSRLSKNLGKISNATKKATSSITKLTSSVKFLGKMFAMSLMFQGITYAMNGMKEGFNNLVLYSAKANKNASAMATSMLQLRNALASAFQPIITAAVPYLQIFINHLIKAIDFVGKFFTVLLTGQKTYTRAKKAQVDYSKTLKNTGKTAKKTAKDIKSIMSFDNINMLSPNDKEEDSDKDNDNGMPSTKEMFEEVPIESNITKAVEKLRKVLEKLKKKLEPVRKALKKLWDEGLSKLGNFAWGTLKDFYHDFLVPVGNWTLGKGLPRFINATNTLLNNIDWKKIQKSLDKLYKALAPFAINIGEGLLWFYEKVLVPLGTWVANEVVPRFLDTLTIAIKTLNTVIDILKPSAKWFFDKLLKPLAEWTGGLFLSVWDKINEALSKFQKWCEKNPETIENIATVIGSFATAWGLVNTAIKIWNAIGAIATVVTNGLAGAVAFLTSPIGIAVIAIGSLIAIGVLLYKNWDKVKEKAKEIWNKIYSNVARYVERAKERIKNCINKIKEVFNKFNTFLKDVFQKDFSKSFGAFGEIINAFKKNVQNIWNAIKKIFSGIIDFITGVFTGDWKKAWEGVKKIFGGIFDGLVAVAKAPLNLVIGLINTMLKGIFDGMNGVIKKVNKLASKLPDWMPGGGGIPTIDTSKIKIPPLATGGYVKPNTPQLAMIGDNRHQGEVVAPEDKLEQLLNNAILQNTAMIVRAVENAMSKQKGGDIELVVNLGDKKIARAVLNVAAAEKKRMGKVVYDI
ncbi:MAG: hypothetical protein HFJ09_13340 [Lachnospiraceae bacterium]|nr:hypothetical protein [Lachnospiraceae bacterium]